MIPRKHRTETPEEGSGTLWYSTDGSAFESLALTTTVDANVYIAEIPVVACFDQIDFYFSAEDTTLAISTSPSVRPTWA